MYEYLFLGIINAIIITTTYLLESNVLMKKEHAKVITYENITLITADKEEELKEDIKLRTGLTVHRLNVQKIDFLRDAAQIKIYYYEV